MNFFCLIFLIFSLISAAYTISSNVILTSNLFWWQIWRWINNVNYFHNLFYAQVHLEWWIAIINILKCIYTRNFRPSNILVQIWLCTSFSNQVSQSLYKAPQFSKGENANHIWAAIWYWATHYSWKSITLFKLYKVGKSMTPGAVLFSPRYYAHNLEKLSEINAVYVFIPWTFTVTFFNVWWQRWL